MKEFERAYKSLNVVQRQAVEATQGPVLVIAGPGTGKTQLLALRAAHIIQTDPTILPSNILCLTFTDNAAQNMRQRLVQYIGQDAYQVAIHTFNSFGQYVMNAHPEYFYEWRFIQTADELTTHDLLERILARLLGDHPLATRGESGEFYAQNQLKNLIGDAKRADLSPKDLAQVLSENKQTYDLLLPIFHQFWPTTLQDKTALDKINKCLQKLQPFKATKSKVEAIVPIADILITSLKDAAKASGAQEGRARTKPFSAWKADWLEFDENKQLVFRPSKHHENLLAATNIYEQYQAELKEQGRADFNDQIMWVLQAMRTHSDLRYNLQERFQYIMIDEFQDTNRSQLLMAHYLTDAPVHEGRPNIMAVGDDDQAIFRFQGADIGNVALFESYYQNPTQVTLGVNYRSTAEILKGAREIAMQIGLSLEKQKNLDKTLKPTTQKRGGGLVLNEFEHESGHYSWVARQIKKLLEGGESGKEVAVLAREKAQLDDLLPYLREQEIPINYERRENVLEKEHITALLTMAKLVYALQQKNLEEANMLFSQVLSQPMWGLAPSEIWKIATEAHQSQRYWLDIMIAGKNQKAKQIADFFVGLGFKSAQLPLEQVIDELVGTGENPFSPFKSYYFSEELLAKQPGEYLTLLSHLNTLRQHLRNYQADYRRTLYLKDLLEFVDAYSRAPNLTMLDHAPHNENDNAVQLMTVHKAKGLEFGSVFVIGLQNEVWTRSGSRGRFSYPANLKTIRPSNNQDDDGLRLLFVAMTRAKHSLYLNYFLKDEMGNPHQPYGPLLGIKTNVGRPKTTDEYSQLASQYEQRWLTHHGSIKQDDLQAFFEEQLSRYQLSVTELNNFLDVSRGGPNYFFMQNLLHFPESRSPLATYGSVVHAALSQSHSDVLAGKKFSLPKIIDYFNKELERQTLSDADKQYFKRRGQEALSAYFSKSGDLPTKNQVIDIDFRRQGVSLSHARLAGLIDRMDLDKESKTLTVIDYKTSSPIAKWQSAPKVPERKKIQLYRYRNQLLFYKLLVDRSADWGARGWKLEKSMLCFIEPDSRGRVYPLALTYEQIELSRFKKIVEAVWAHIQRLEFPNTSSYPPTVEGIRAFEEDLVSKAV